jgi:Hemerythrin HHE cation binding domain/Phasin protein
MTITQLIQNSPSKANELFGKLADTSDGAVKTREKLFSELKDELETLASLEEKHLFPVLRKHQETKDLVVDAINDNKEVRKLLADLEKIPKTDPEFAPKLGELRKIFQQHVRDEKKELLPAVRKALSAEETQTVIERIEAGRAEAESDKKDEGKERKTEERKAEAKSGNGAAEKSQPAEEKSKASQAAQVRQYDEGKSREAVASRKADEAADNAAPAKRMLEAGADEASKIPEAAAEVSREVADAGAKAAQRSLRVVEASADIARSASDATAQSTRQVAEMGTRQAERAVSTMAETTRAASQSVEPLIRGFTAFSEIPGTSLTLAQDVGQVWSDLVKKNLETSARASQEMFRMTSPQQVVQAQSRFAAEFMQTWMDAGSRMMEISLRASGGVKLAVQGAAKEMEKARSAGS